MHTSPSLIATCAAIVMSVSPAWAGCPTLSDLDDGIVLAQNEPFFMRSDFTTSPEGGFVERRVDEATGTPRETMAFYKHGLAMVGEHSPAGHVEITYVDRLAPLETLPDIGRVSVSGIAKGPLGEAYVELDISFIERGSRTVGDCTFETWSVTSTLKDRDGAGATYHMQYAPEIDLVLAASLVGADGSETPVYAYQWAGTVADFQN